MRLHQLVMDRDLAVHNTSTGETVVLTPAGAVFRDEWTSDLTHMCLAFGALLHDTWRPASDEEIEAMRNADPRDRIFEISWTSSPPPEPPRLTRVK